MDRDALCQLSHEDLISLVLAQAAIIARLEKRVSELEDKLGKPPKTPDNSSLPPSSGQKPNLPERERKGRKGRPGVSRKLAENPDQVIEALAQECPKCAATLSTADQPRIHAYDHVDMPPIRPMTTRVHLHSGVCPCCAAAFTAPAPVGMEPGSPFGPGIQALVIHLHVTQAISFERLTVMMKAVFGLDISQGAIGNILQLALEPMMAAANAIGEEVRKAEVIASDETSARVAGRKYWQWVLHTSTAVYHVIADSRAARVLVDFLGGARPKVWVADRYGAQNGHGEQRQVCLAHLLRDAQFAIDSGDDVFAPGLKALLKRACRIGRRRDRLKDTTLAQYLSRLERELTNLMRHEVPHKQGRKLLRAIKKCRADLFVFMTRRDVPYTNNGSERALRMSVVFRKVTGCFRSVWGSQFYAATISVIATGKLHGKTALQAIADVIAPHRAIAAA